MVGGGINGLCCAWELARDGHHVTLFERDGIMQATSRASSKLLHGGIRYLENGQFRLVREGLKERDAWLTVVPHLAQPLPIIYPKYRSGRRGRWMLGAGFGLYTFLSGHSVLPSSRWLEKTEVQQLLPELKHDNLEGGYLYYDAQMDDYLLGKWVAEQCQNFGVEILENTAVHSLSPEGRVKLSDGSKRWFDRLLNVAGPWSEHLLAVSDIAANHHLDLVRGSHLVVDRQCDHALILEVPNERRIFFVLPWQGKTLLGTTEVRQQLEDAITCSEEEKRYLMNAYNHYFSKVISEIELLDAFAGLRPLLRSSVNSGKSSREYALQRNEKLITVFGGKWTTARALAGKVKHKCFA